MCRYNDFRALISNDNGLQTSLWPIIAGYSPPLSRYPFILRENIQRLFVLHAAKLKDDSEKALKSGKAISGDDENIE